jgi:hypothetical protein
MHAWMTLATLSMHCAGVNPLLCKEVLTYVYLDSICKCMDAQAGLKFEPLLCCCRHVAETADTYCGLFGGMTVCRPGMCDADGKPLDVTASRYLNFMVLDENQCGLIE